MVKVTMNKREARLLLAEIENIIRWRGLLTNRDGLLKDNFNTVDKIYTKWPDLKDEFQLVRNLYSSKKAVKR